MPKTQTSESVKVRIILDDYERESLTLRIVVDDYDQAQRVRVGKGEQIRAIAQGRDQQDAGYLERLGFVDVTKVNDLGETVVVKSAADLLLEAILQGETDEPNSYLAWAYRRSHEMEREAYSKMDGLLEAHPAWGWARQVRGVSFTLGERARTHGST